MRWIVRLLALAVVLYAAVVAVMYVRQRELLYPASQHRATAAEAGLAGFEDVVLVTQDGERLVAWYEAPRPGKALILYFHGNAGSLWSRRGRARLLTEDGRGLLMVSYRGYSGSTGTPTELGLRSDARAAYDWVAQRFPPARIVLYGESLGTGVAVRLATERPVGGIILDAPYTSTADVAGLRYPYLPIALLMQDQFRSLDIVDRIKAPLLILHGDRDRVVPFAEGERLFAAAPEPKTFVRIPEGDHGHNLESGLDAVRAFLDKVEAKLPPLATEPASDAAAAPAPKPAAPALGPALP